MSKEINTPNFTPIENFLDCFAQNVYERGWEAKTEQQLIRCIESKKEEYQANFAESLLEGVKAKVKSLGDIGVNALFK